MRRPRMHSRMFTSPYLNRITEQPGFECILSFLSNNNLTSQVPKQVIPSSPIFLGFQKHTLLSDNYESNTELDIHKRNRKVTLHIRMHIIPFFATFVDGLAKVCICKLAVVTCPCPSKGGKISWRASCLINCNTLLKRDDLVIIKQTSITEHGAHDSLKISLAHSSMCKQDLWTSHASHKHDKYFQTRLHKEGIPKCRGFFNHIFCISDDCFPALLHPYNALLFFAAESGTLINYHLQKKECAHFSTEHQIPNQTNFELRKDRFWNVNGITIIEKVNQLPCTSDYNSHL